MKGADVCLRPLLCMYVLSVFFGCVYMLFAVSKYPLPPPCLPVTGGCVCRCPSRCDAGRDGRAKLYLHIPVLQLQLD